MRAVIEAVAKSLAHASSIEFYEPYPRLIRVLRSVAHIYNALCVGTLWRHGVAMSSLLSVPLEGPGLSSLGFRADVLPFK